MDHYVEIRLLPDPEFPTNILMDALFNKLHRALVKLQSDNIAVSFPAYQAKSADIKHATLGAKLRLHGTENVLQSLLAGELLIGMRDHVKVGGPYSAGAPQKHLIFKRVQARSNVERVRRRYMKRHMVTQEEVENLLPASIEETLDLPFVTLKSSSTGQKFPLFIKQIEASEPQSGKFSKYGLSTEATVPLF